MPRVFQSLAGALTRCWQRRLRCIPDEQYISPSPSVQRLQIVHGNQLDGVCGRGLDEARDRLRPFCKKIQNIFVHIRCGLRLRQWPRLSGRPVHQIFSNSDATETITRTPVVLNLDVAHQWTIPPCYSDPVHEALINWFIVPCDKLACHRVHATIRANKQIWTDNLPIFEPDFGLAVGIQVYR